jgi:DNA-binding response OmpR family regulator
MQTILVAEDDAVMRNALESLFEAEGYCVIGVPTLRDAANEIGHRVLDAAVVDWMLGPDVSEPVLSTLVKQGVATVLLSAHPEARVIAESFGIPHVHKPFVVDQLVGIVSGAVSRQTLRRIALSRG